MQEQSGARWLEGQVIDRREFKKTAGNMIDDSFSDSEEEKEEIDEDKYEVLVVFNAFPHVQEWMEENSGRVAVFRSKTQGPMTSGFSSVVPSEQTRPSEEFEDMVDRDVHDDTEHFLEDARNLLIAMNQVRYERENIREGDRSREETYQN